MSQVEILAPAGSMEAVLAAVRTGADAVYLGGQHLNARHGTKNFSPEELKKVVTYCHARGVAVHLTLNTIVFDEELKLAEEAIRQGAEAGVDAFIIQDLGMAELAKRCAPSVQRHGSTQMSIHNVWGVKQLAELGFSRAVLARELTVTEIAAIVKESPIEIEVFVHGALCSSVSGQCYISGLIGGRSGNRGRCAQTCRLPFQSEGASHALSLKDLSVISQIPYLSSLGVDSFKIEGRLKRPEYVAAAVTAAKQVLQGEEPDYDTLEAIFSRSGFTDGYLQDARGEEMFGTRTREDVVSAKGTLRELAGLYHQEQPRIPVEMTLSMNGDHPTELTVSAKGKQVTITGEAPQVARTASTTPERAQAALGKTGNTPFYLEKLQCDLEEGYMLPVSQINELRRQALDQLLEKLETPEPKEFTSYSWEENHGAKLEKSDKVRWRIRFNKRTQFSTTGFPDVEEIVLPIEEIFHLEEDIPQEERGKILLELPRTSFGLESQERLEHQLSSALERGFTKVLVGDYGGFYIARQYGMEVHGDFGLNVTNDLALCVWKTQGLVTGTMSMEYGIAEHKTASPLPKGILAYGYLPAMMFRNHPAGMKQKNGKITDRLGKEFLVEKTGETSTLYNCVPLYLADRWKQVEGLDFYTFYFTGESKEECQESYRNYREGQESSQPYTRGNYRKRVL